jgi:hypothetical protein
VEEWDSTQQSSPQSDNATPVVDNLGEPSQRVQAVAGARLVPEVPQGIDFEPALLRYLADARAARHVSRRLERRIAKRFDADAVQLLVTEYRSGATAAALGRRHGLAKSSVLRLVRQAGERVRPPRFSVDETARLVELYEAGLRKGHRRTACQKPGVLCGTALRRRLGPGEELDERPAK